MKLIRKSILAGIMIGISSTVYLSVNNKIIGALLFSIGLFMICSFKMYLFTGKVGYMIITKFYFFKVKTRTFINYIIIYFMWIFNVFSC